MTWARSRAASPAISGRIAASSPTRVVEDDLDLRPIHHQLEHRIAARIFVAFMAEGLHVTLRARLRPRAGGPTPRAALDKLARIHMLDAHVPTTDGRTLILARRMPIRPCCCARSASSSRRSRRPASPIRTGLPTCVVKTFASPVLILQRLSPPLPLQLRKLG